MYSKCKMDGLRNVIIRSNVLKSSTEIAGVIGSGGIGKARDVGAVAYHTPEEPYFLLIF